MNTVLCILAAGLGNPPAAPLYCPAPVAAKGEVKAGPALVHTFHLTHSGGPGLLTITRVEAGCGCLRRVLPCEVLRPGESTTLTIEVNTLTQPDGPNRWPIAVSYRHEPPAAPPSTGEIILAISASLSRDVTVSPPQVGFSSTGAASQVLTVKDSRSRPLTVLRATSSSPHLAVEIGRHEPGQPQAVTVKLSADMPPGHRDEYVVLLTDDPDYPEFRVPVRVLKRPAGGVTASPDALALRLAPGQAEASALIQLRANDGKPIALASAESDLPGVTVKYSTGSGPVAVVRVTVTEAAASQPGNCTVRIQLAEPAGQQVLVPVLWTGGKKDR
jgi:hypothetical protein